MMRSEEKELEQRLPVSQHGMFVDFFNNQRNQNDFEKFLLFNMQKFSNRKESDDSSL